MHFEVSDLKEIVKTIINNHGSPSEAHRVTGVSKSYISRVMSGDLNPKYISFEIHRKLLKGLTERQREAFLKQEDIGKTQLPAYSREELMERLDKLSPIQVEALLTIAEMIH